MKLDEAMEGLSPAGQMDFLEELLGLGLITAQEMLENILYAKPLRIKLETEYIETRLP